LSRSDENGIVPRQGADGSAEGLSQAFYRDRNVADARTGPGDSRVTLLRSLAAWGLPMFLLLFLADLALEWAFPPEALLPYMQKEIAFYTMKVERFGEGPVPDVLFIGSSRMRDAVIPSVFAADLASHLERPVNAFNLGLGGAQAVEYHALVSSHLPDPPPPYVILGFSGTEVAHVQNFAYASRFLWSVPNFISYLKRTSFKDFRVKHVEYFIESLLCRFWYLFEYRDSLSKRIAEPIAAFLGLEKDPGDPGESDAERSRIIANVLAEDGYEPFLSAFTNLEHRLKNNPKSIRKKMQKRELIKDPDMFDDATILLLKEIVSCLRGKGSRVALVETPPSPYLQALNPVLHGRGFRTFMSRAAKEIDVLFLPFTPWETGLSNAMYGDLSHLSKAGAEIYSHFLFHKLRQAGFFEGDGP
jgi:hypothetical protein